MNQKFDIAIIGGGVVGCAMARRLTLNGANVVILEKALDVLDGASKGNSAILHTGFDAPPRSVEHTCIARGYEEYLEVAQSFGLPILKTGALVLAWDEDQLATLPELIAKAKENGVDDALMLTRNEILDREPGLSKNLVGGFEVKGEFLIDPWASAHAYLVQAMINGATLVRGAEVLSGEFDGAAWHLTTPQGKISAKQVVNCAGLYGDIVDERLIGETCFKVTPRKGQFVVFDKMAADLVNSIILPVPTKKTKGIVVCKTIFGNLLVGPTAEDQDDRVDASTTRDELMALRQRGIEMIPQLEGCEVNATYAGLRPATQFSDYQIRAIDEKNYICVGGIRSTGLTGSLGIAQYVAQLIDGQMFSNPPIAAPHIPEVDRLSNYHPRSWQEPDHGGIVCHCELVTRREIEKALHGPMPPQSLQGLKRRTRVCMGRCQGFYCTAELAEMTKGHFEIPLGVENDK